jgi:HK97 family phage major capsid protein
MINHVGTYSQMGYFVPDGFYPQLFAALKAADPLFNDGDVTVIHDTTGRPLPIPVASDVENIAVVVGEHDQSNTEVDIASVSQKVLGAYSYITPRMVVSLEAFQDLPASFSAVSLFKRFVYDRVARGVSADMLNGNGVGKTLGLLPSLEALGTVPVVASGAFAVGEDFPDYTAANSIGPQDLANLLAALDPAYLASPKCAWLMNNSTLGFLNGLTDTIGRPIEIVKYFNGTPSIYGIPVKVSPSMPGIGVSQTPVILGALDYWITRLVVGEDSGIQVFSEAPGLAENGAVALRFFIRADGTLAFNDVNAPAPMVMLRNHS